MTNLRSRSFILSQYFKYWLKATGSYSLHAPFIFQFFNSIISDRRIFYVFEEIENIRKKLINNLDIIDVLDLGAGSQIIPGRERTISDIAGSSLSSPKFSQFLFRLVLNRNPTNIVELGTSLGINTLYLAKANSKTPVVTMEGCPNIAKIAVRNFEKMACENITLVEGDIDCNLELVLSRFNTIDFVYFDANHTQEATLRYFELCLSKVNENSIFVFDDIHLSIGMNKAWKLIKTNPIVALSIDIFDAGIIFFDKRLQKQDYILEF